ncbi:hypothetical protein [Sulfuricurvum sp.]|uniref:hypothetical protein n=1 Tax=Sulfuricurvum sp. TaxID=2025608 RepID=UPI002E339B28|nr:hypothetical protein [Sulfuricurvum sp.]HEX5330629.1 hypothetical protein [Sulfuricurvum sp.]
MANPKRSISAVRNIIAGIILLYKEKLRRLSPNEQPELLIKQNIKPFLVSGRLTFVGVGNTVNIDTIRTRFADLGISAEWKRFDKVVSLRNDLEHYFTKKSTDDIKELISSSFLLIRDFVTNELEEDPLEVLGLETWEILLEVNDIFMAEKEECEESLNQVDWKYDTIKENLDLLRCEECGSPLVYIDDATGSDYPDIFLRCRQCNHNFEFTSIIEEFVGEALYTASFMSQMDGGEPMNTTCPECSMETYVFEEECCVACNYEMRYAECSVCHTALEIHEQNNGGLCGYHQDKYEKEKYK